MREEKKAGGGACLMILTKIKRVECFVGSYESDCAKRVLAGQR